MLPFGNNSDWILNKRKILIMAKTHIMKNKLMDYEMDEKQKIIRQHQSQFSEWAIQVENCSLDLAGFPL